MLINNHKLMSYYWLHCRCFESCSQKGQTIKAKTWFADDSEDNASKEDNDDAEEDASRDGKKHPPL